jgi:hypothetical protein
MQMEFHPREPVHCFLSQPDKALVLCVDEKNRIQAIERSQPSLPVRPSHFEGVANGYCRHGTMTLFAALDVATDEALRQFQARHRHQEFPVFLQHLDRYSPKD